MGANESPPTQTDEDRLLHVLLVEGALFKYMCTAVAPLAGAAQSLELYLTNAV